jgi:hypothetical protein
MPRQADSARLGPSGCTRLDRGEHQDRLVRFSPRTEFLLPNWTTGFLVWSVGRLKDSVTETSLQTSPLGVADVIALARKRVFGEHYWAWVGNADALFVSPAPSPRSRHSRSLGQNWNDQLEAGPMRARALVEQLTAVGVSVRAGDGESETGA